MQINFPFHKASFLNDNYPTTEIGLISKSLYFVYNNKLYKGHYHSNGNFLFPMPRIYSSRS